MKKGRKVWRLSVWAAVLILLLYASAETEAMAGDILPDNVYLARNGKYRMEIYDIEDGYLHVPFLPKLPRHDYDWDRLNLEKESGFLSYEDEKYSDTKIGIDVSKFQGNINWEEVSISGIDFVMIRLGYRGYSNGNLALDKRFKDNTEGALEAGLDVGVYFFSQAVNEEEAVEEAAFVIEELKDYDIKYPVTFDTEKIKFDTSRAEKLTVTELTQITAAFCDEIKEAGYRPMIYANSQWLTKKLDLTELMDYELWYADYEYADHGNTPLYPYEFRMWQYTNKGSIEGIDGEVDLNILFE